MNPIKFTVPIVPMAKQGDRSRIIGSKFGKRYVQHYQPKKITQHAKELSLLVIPYRPSVPWEGPLAVHFIFDFPWNKSATKAQRAFGRERKSTRPDLDNLCKQTLDVLQGCGFFRDDAQVVDLRVSKWYADEAAIGIHVARFE